MCRLVVLIDPEERDVEIVAWIREVVGIAAEECDVEFRRKHQADIRILLVLVKVVDLSGVEGNDIATQPSRRGTVFFHLRHGGALRLPGISRRHPGLHARVHFVGHILNADQLIQFQGGAFGFIRLGFGIETGLDVIVAFG